MNYNLDFNNLEVLKRNSFEGNSNPSLGGIYLILNFDEETPEYLAIGTGRFFKSFNRSYPFIYILF
jgi:hypothetical protein